MFNSITTNETDTRQLSWTEELSIGDDLIDADHQAIFETANRLQAELAEDPEHSIVGEVLVELIEHTGGHFIREEALMLAIRYPGFEAHKREHNALMNKVNNLHRQFMDGQRNISVDVWEFIQKALVPHILHSDRELGRSMGLRK